MRLGWGGSNIWLCQRLLLLTVDFRSSLSLQSVQTSCYFYDRLPPNEILLPHNYAAASTKYRTGGPCPDARGLTLVGLSLVGPAAQQAQPVSPKLALVPCPPAWRLTSG